MKVENNQVERQRRVLEEVLDDDEKAKLLEEWAKLPAKEQKMRPRNIRKFFAKMDLSPSKMQLIMKKLSER